MDEFSLKTRGEALVRMGREEFDLFIVGGGITGAAVARDAASRGLKVALAEKKDFAWGTSSRSSKLIHGGLRYLQNFEFGLVFEALAERFLLLKKAPHLVKPLPFYMPVYQGDKNGKNLLSMGLWLYDTLALFRGVNKHKRLSKNKFLNQIPFIRSQGLKGGFRYYDASMADDGLVVETVRSAAALGVAVANYVEAVKPVWQDDKIVGYQLKDLEGGQSLTVKAKKTIVCAGPWTDVVGKQLSKDWKTWLGPSKGVHLIFDLKKIPVPGALVMSEPSDGRIAFVIPRPDMGDGIAIVGTTDGPSPQNPEDVTIDGDDVEYLMSLLKKYFPSLKLDESDIISAYVGIRPLMNPDQQDEGQDDASSLQKVSREHTIDHGPGRSVVVAGGKYTTHRSMASEIVDFALASLQEDGLDDDLSVVASDTKAPVNPGVLPEQVEQTRLELKQKKVDVPESLLTHYGRGVLLLAKIKQQLPDSFDIQDPAGFPWLAARLIYAMRYEMVMHLEDFFLRRLPLFLTRADGGKPWVEVLSQLWAHERGLSSQDAQKEAERLNAEIARRSAWRKRMAIKPKNQSKIAS